MKSEERIKELEESIEFWETKRNQVYNQVDKTLLSNKIKKAKEEISSLKETKEEPKVTHIVDAPPIADKDSSISTRLLERGQVIDTSSNATLII